MRKISLQILSVLSLSACAPQNYEALDSIATQAKQDISCKSKNLESNFWDGLKTYLIEKNEIPSALELKTKLRLAMDDLQTENPGFTEADAKKISEKLERLLQTILEVAPKGEGVSSAKELLVLLSAIDVGDRTTQLRSNIQDSVRLQFTDLNSTIHSYDLHCNSTAPEPAKDQPTEVPVSTSASFEAHNQEAHSNGIPLSVLGARWALATAYQSCQSAELPPMTAQSPSLEGVKISGKHPDGIGLRRVIASLPLVQNSHYYLRDVSSYAPGCFNVRNSPLIYDYGGKPYATTAASSPIDFFKDNGDGTSVLGIDCSGYIFSAMATAGLKLKAGRPLKASDSWGWGSSSYVEPQQNGLTCLNKISVSPKASLQAGDIVAVNGHMLMIDKTGTDPFGIAEATTEQECRQISYRNFDFVVIQSSSSKNGLGINKYVVREYLPTSDKMKVGLEKYAYYACMAKVTGRSYTPNLGTLSVVRHKGTSECIAPRITLAKESCIRACPQL